MTQSGLTSNPSTMADRGTSSRSRPTFLARAATDVTNQLQRRSSRSPFSREATTYKPNALHDLPEQRQDKSPDRASGGQPSSQRLFARFDPRRADEKAAPPLKERSRSCRRKSSHAAAAYQDPQRPIQQKNGTNKYMRSDTTKVGTFPRPVGGSSKLGTLSGVFVPTTLNVLSILMFIRFGFILGQSGVLGTMGMMIVAYLINLVTTMSISAVASNGTVRGGGAYYLISRSLGPEFGGSIGIVFYMGFVFNTGLNAVGLVDCLIYNFGSQSGNWSRFLPEGFWWQYLWATIVLIFCTAICLAGSGIFARCSNGLVAILLIATLSIPYSSIVGNPFNDPVSQITFTGPSLKTLKENFMPNFTKHAAGSQLKTRENFQDLFGVLFPATGGIFAGASMSGDLKNPSKSIPKGTLYGLALTFVSYTLVIFAMAASISRASLYNNLNVIQDTNVSGILILLGEFATTFFSALMGVIGPAKLLQAIARDSLLPGLSAFGQGTRQGDEPTYAIILTFIVAQLTMLFDINRIASFITMTYLMTFLVTNLACFLLTISSAPNFRPSFRYFNWWTAAAGTLACAITMFVVDGVSASGAVGILIVIFLLIHYTTPPKPWGDVSQSLIYHQVRKYLLRLKQDHVKFWRPQILLFVNDPRRGYKLIQFCNSLKKGALFVLGHVIVTTNFGASVPEARRQQAAWAKYIDLSKVKAFINVAISPSIEWGARNVALSAGLGGMRPNIVIMGLYNLKQFRQDQPLVDVPSPPPERESRKEDKATSGLRKRRSVAATQLEGALPTDECYIEKQTDVQSYLMVLEDMLLKLQINVAVAAGFNDLELPSPSQGNSKRYIDLWPIQMSATLSSNDEETGQDVMTTNFDTYTLILQLGCILNTVPSWKKSYNLRVAVFVEYESDVEEERARVATLLDNLRIRAEILVFWLASGNVRSYEIIVNGDYSNANVEVEEQVEKILEDEKWWPELKRHRGKLGDGDLAGLESIPAVEELSNSVPVWPTASFQHGRRAQSVVRFEGLKQLLTDARRRSSMANVNNPGASLGMRTHSLDKDLISRHMDDTSSTSEGSDWNDDESFDSISAVEGSEEEGRGEGEEGGGGSVSSEEIGSHKGDGSGKKSDSRNTSVRDEFFTSNSTSVLKPRPKDSSSTSSSASYSSAKESRRPAAQVAESQGFDILSNTGKGNADSSLINISPRKRAPSIPGLESPQGEMASQLDLGGPDARHQLSQHGPCGRFSSSPLPSTKLAGDEGPGPSIMFAEDSHPRRTASKPVRTSTDRTLIPSTSAFSSSATSRMSSTSNSSQPERLESKERASSSSSPSPSTAAAEVAAAVAAASIPLSFNDLPCRAQHLILNELITQHSEDTAVVFTTLPAPVEGTYRSESESLAYVSDLEVLCGGLPPTLMVHSNSMTVTTNL